MKKEIERLQEQYKDVLKGNEIILQMEKSDALDNKSPRCYRVAVVLGIDDNCKLDTICEYGFCKDKEEIIKKFENKLIERRNG